jgi:hypothetical protein
MNTSGLLRIGELSRRTGITPELPRAWERRYGLLRPTRTPGGLRLYSHEDVERVQAMQRHLAEGLAAAQAATLALEPRGDYVRRHVPELAALAGPCVHEPWNARSAVAREYPGRIVVPDRRARGVQAARA